MNRPFFLLFRKNLSQLVILLEKANVSSPKIEIVSSEEKKKVE